MVFTKPPTPRSNSSCQCPSYQNFASISTIHPKMSFFVLIKIKSYTCITKIRRSIWTNMKYNLGYTSLLEKAIISRYLLILEYYILYALLSLCKAFFSLHTRDSFRLSNPWNCCMWISSSIIQLRKFVFTSIWCILHLVMETKTITSLMKLYLVIR